MTVLTDVLEFRSNLPFQKQVNGYAFPLVAVPKDRQNQAAFPVLLKYLQLNRPMLDDLLLKHGAILFRGFACLESPKEFNEFVEQGLGETALEYVGGAAPRKVVYKNVFTSNESPPDQPIPFHHEMAQVPTYPGKIYFYASVPAKAGGQTPLLRSDFLYQRLCAKFPEFMQKVEREGLVYTRVLPTEDDPSSPIGRGWKSTFQTTDFAEAQRKAKTLGVTLEKITSKYQNEKGEMVEEETVKSTSSILSAVREYNKAGVKVFFNSMIAAFTGWQDKRNDRTKAVTFGNGESLDPVVMEAIQKVMEDVCVEWVWEKNDLVCVDNNLAMHSRRTFEPPRTLLAYVAK